MEVRSIQDHPRMIPSGYDTGSIATNPGRAGRRCALAGLLFLLGCGPLFASETILLEPSPPPAELLELLNAIGAEDQVTVDAILRTHPELAMTGIGISSYQWAQTPQFRLPQSGETNTWRTQSTVLHFACLQGNLLAATRLLACGAPLHALDQLGDSPLETAFRCQQAAPRLQVVELLLSKGAEANRDRGIGWRPIHRLVQTDAANDKELLTILLAAGADIHAEADNGGTPLMLAARDTYYGMDTAGAIENLIAHGAEVNRRDRHGRTALMYAAREGNYGAKFAVRTLMAHGADLWLRDEDGLNVRDHAFARGQNGRGAMDKVTVLAALYPYYDRLPGGVQVVVLLCALAAVGWWVRRKNRAPPALTAATWAAGLGLPAEWQTQLAAGALQQVPVRVGREQAYRRWLWRTLPAVAAGICLTVFTALDSFHVRAPTSIALMVYAAGYLIAYAALFLRFRWFTTLVLMLGIPYTVLGVFFLILQGVLFQEQVQETMICVMWCGVGGLFVFQAVVLIGLSYRSLRMDWFDSRVRRRCKAAMQAAEQTGIETRDSWDSGG